ncbi:hypothetical protein [Mycobacterium sp. HM-7]
MSRIDDVNTRYEFSAGLVARGVELVVIGDPPSARVNAAVRQQLLLAREDPSGFWDDLVGAAKALRWRLLTQPQPVELNNALTQSVNDVAEEAARLRSGISPAHQLKLDELVAAATGVLTEDPVLGSVLVESIFDAGVENCVVIAASGAAAAGLESWLGPRDVVVREAGQFIRNRSFSEQAYVVGPPRFFTSSLVTTPRTESLTYLMPAWFRDRSIPRSVLAAYAEGALEIEARSFNVGDASEPAITHTEDTLNEQDLLPQPVWNVSAAVVRDPGRDEVAARRVLLSGGYAILLDDGERIRAVAPAQPGGERVAYVDVDAVAPGTYLMLRDGETERQALYDAALKLLGAHAPATEQSQARWKGELQARLDRYGQAAVIRDLAKAGVQTLDRVGAWTEPTLARPRSDRDFGLLLEWLGVPLHPTYELATALRRKRSQASADVADQLEQAVGEADMDHLQRVGHMRLETKAEGFRGVIATRVLALAPTKEIVLRHDVRVPFLDRGAKWLE